MGSIQKSKIQEIINLHKDLESLYRQGLTMAIRIGELLTKIKLELPHGKFQNWVKNNLPFTKQTAFNYRKLYRIRKNLKSKRILLLNDAYVEAGILKAKTIESVSIKDTHLIKDNDDCTYLDIKDIDPNPFFDISHLVTEHVKWNIGILQSSMPVIRTHLAIRPYKDRYQNICDHDKYYALQFLGWDKVWVYVVDIKAADDKFMKKMLKDFDYPKYKEYTTYLDRCLNGTAGFRG